MNKNKKIQSLGFVIVVSRAILTVGFMFMVIGLVNEIITSCIAGSVRASDIPKLESEEIMYSKIKNAGYILVTLFMILSLILEKIENKNSKKLFSKPYFIIFYYHVFCIFILFFLKASSNFYILFDLLYIILTIIITVSLFIRMDSKSSKETPNCDNNI